jgi:hypothetical protein
MNCDSLTGIPFLLLKQQDSSGIPSAPMFAITDAQLSINRVELNENTDFSVRKKMSQPLPVQLVCTNPYTVIVQGSVVVLIRSSVSIDQSCFQGGSSDFLVFIANDSTFEVSENFVDNFVSDRCQATGPRLFQENDGSGCFLGSSTCEGTCLVLADQATCRAQQTPPSASTVPTKAPLMLVPTEIPIKAPVSGPIMPPMTPTTSPTTNPAGTPISPTTNPADVPTISTLPTFIPSEGPGISAVPSDVRSVIPSVIPTQEETAKPPSKGGSKKGKGGMMMGKSKKKPDMCIGMGMMMGKGKECIDEGKGGKGKGGMMAKGKSSSKGKGSDPGPWEPPALISLEPSLAPTENSFGKGKGKGKGKVGRYKKTAWFRSILNATFESTTESGDKDMVVSNSSADTGAVWGNASQVIIPAPDTYVDVKVEDNNAGRRRRIQYHPDR